MKDIGAYELHMFPFAKVAHDKYSQKLALI